MVHLRKVIIISLCLLDIQCFSQSKLGLFDAQSDVGKLVKKGSATFISATGQYIISGAGYNVWFDHDEFHYVYRKIKGDFILYCRADLVGQGINQHRKLGWMVRKSLDGNSAQVNAVVHGDGLTSLQYRKNDGAQTEEKKCATTYADVIQLERKGNIYTIRVAKFGEPFIIQQVSELDIGEDLYVGLFVGSHDPDIIETGVFRDVRISVPYKESPGEQVKMNLGSNLELLDVASGAREIILSVPNSIQAPNWSKDGRSLIYNDNRGLMYSFDLNSRIPILLNTGKVTNNNNDHVLSFDGKMLGLSSFEKQLGGSIIYTVPVTGGDPKQITPTGPSYLHGWSPDNKYLVFCGERKGNFDVYIIPSDGGAEERLTDAEGLDDGPEYTPDGKYIYFNSVRSGLMQIWKMLPDGSHQEQVTKDDYNNWFAHISPDGKSMVFLSFLKEEVEPGQHPPYKHVYIRMMTLNGGNAKIIAYLYGGQGSINTPSWSPDSKRIAFISNSGMIEK